jgi:hypothetical protein
MMIGNQVTRISGGRTSEHLDIRKSSQEVFNLMPGSPDISYLII